MNQSKVKKSSEHNRLDVSPNKPSNSPANATVKLSANGPENTRGVYAEISLATPTKLENEAKTEHPGIVYASLEFQKEPTNMEPDTKRAHTTVTTKVGPLGDIYAISDAKVRAVT